MLAACKRGSYWVAGVVMVMVMTMAVSLRSARAPERNVQAHRLVGLSLLAANAADLNPAALAYKLPGQISWSDEANGAKRAVMVGDPEKAGLYIVLIKWTAHHMSRPHFHPNDRFITVISGTWWVGTGAKFNPESTVAIPAGSFVTHFGKQIHYDGAKDGDAVLEIVGEGPATATPAEVK